MFHWVKWGIMSKLRGGTAELTVETGRWKEKAIEGMWRKRFCSPEWLARVRSIGVPSSPVTLWHVNFNLF